MKCRFCGGKLRRVTNVQRKDERHRWYRCYDCDKKMHTVERCIVPGPDPGIKGHGNNARGSRNGSSVFTEEDILRMRQMAADGVMQKDIMKIFGISQPYVSKIICRKVWTHI